jgi:uncharacterized membrane protein YidH (DUF202 family)
VALIAFGGYMSVTSYRHWQRTERSLRLSQPPPPSALSRFLAGGVSAATIAAAGLAVLLYAGK